MNILDARAVHLIGAGGFGMAALGAYLLDRGVVVTGSDLRESPGLKQLVARGARIAVGPHAAAGVPADAAVVASAAIHADNPERRIASERGQLVLGYPEALGRLMAGRDGVAIAGTHGKTTTTALVVAGLAAAGLEPSFVVGGEVPAFGAAGRSGGGPHFVAEACEYAASFLQLAFRVAAITNVEPDHLDWYGSFDAVVASFRAFAERVPRDGVLVTTPEVRARIGAVDARVVTVSLDGAADLVASRIRVERGFPTFDVEGASRLEHVALRMPGRHSVANALVALGVLSALRVDLARARRGIEAFAGVARRFEVLAETPGAVVLSDYAHHPTALRAVADAVRTRYPGRRVVAIFQPHQVSRTRDFFAEFAAALAAFDVPILTDVYGAREGDASSCAQTAAGLAEAARETNPRARYAGPLTAVVPCVEALVEPGDVVLLLGAGDIDDLRDELPDAVSGALRRRTA